MKMMLKTMHFVILAFVLLSCDVSKDDINSSGRENNVEKDIAISSSEPKEFDREVHEEKKTAWESLNITNYRFTAKTRTLANWQSSQGTIIVQPESEPQITIHDEESFYSYVKPFFPLEGKTINELFASINTVAENEEHGFYKILYNATYNYPEEFFLSYTEGIGKGLWFKVSNFEILEKP